MTVSSGGHGSQNGEPLPGISAWSLRRAHRHSLHDAEYGHLVSVTAEAKLGLK
ncbi:hypothetical protein AB0N17_33680 [Streptomyces sp. NPDC051133]|uniref:hypothetical protein n=1 Tax=Streptomyces sp. NPDC051133 TaxID=3155521 RepID=UPI003445A259